ncbi:MAG: acyl-CoA dehydrogenase family protein [Pseudomonadota bacterium]
MNEDMNIGAMLSEQLERLFAREVNAALWSGAEDGRFAAALWRQTEEIGVYGALVAEDDGGAGLAWADIEALLRVGGRYAAPIPMGETMIANWALSRAGLALPDGPLAVSGAIWNIDSDGLVSGGDGLVAWLPQCGYLLLVARGAQGDVLCLFETAQLQVEPLATFERTPSGAVALNHLKPLHAAPAHGLGPLGLQPHLAALRSVQMAGLLDAILALCVEYGNTRIQFGKAIGKFQAIQHMIAELAGHAAAAQVAGLYACRQIDSGDAARAEFGAAVAKTRLGSAATRASAIAHQVFGAIGVTDEHQLHYLTRRLWQWRAEAGSEHAWSEWLGRASIAAGGAALWEKLAAHAQA